MHKALSMLTLAVLCGCAGLSGKNESSLDPDSLTPKTSVAKRLDPARFPFAIGRWR